MRSTQQSVAQAKGSSLGHTAAAELSRLFHAESVWASRSDGEPIPYTEADRVMMLDGMMSLGEHGVRTRTWVALTYLAL